MPRLEDCPVCGGGIPADREACSCHQVQAALGASACSAGSDTPETDDNIDRNPDAGTAIVYADFARRLERERDEARRVAELYADRFKALGGYLDQEYFPWKQNANAHQPERGKAMTDTDVKEILTSSDQAQERGLGAVTCSADDLSPESKRWWRGLVKPIFLAMHKHGIGAVHITRTGTKVKFVLEPERETLDQNNNGSARALQGDEAFVAHLRQHADATGYGENLTIGGGEIKWYAEAAANLKRERDEARRGIEEADEIIAAWVKGEGCMDAAFSWMARYTEPPINKQNA